MPTTLQAKLSGAFVAALLSFAHTTTSAATAPAAQVCLADDSWPACAAKVKKALNATSDPLVALAAGAEWAERYNRLYAANARQTWTATDQEKLEEAIEKLWDEAIGKYLDAPTLALGLALARYFPKLSAALELAGGPQSTFFLALLAPSPIANDFVAARADNAAINALVLSKLPPLGVATIRQRYPELFGDAYAKVRGVKPGLN